MKGPSEACRRTLPCCDSPEECRNQIDHNEDDDPVFAASTTDYSCDAFSSGGPPDPNTTLDGLIDYELLRSTERCAPALVKSTKKPKRSATRAILPDYFAQLTLADDRTNSASDQQQQQQQLPHTQQTNATLVPLHATDDPFEPVLLSSSIQEIENEECPITAVSMTPTRLLLSPRNSIIATRHMYLDPNAAQSAPNLLAIGNRQWKLAKLAKNINSLSQKIEKYEFQFEEKHGHKLSHADKMANKAIRKLYTELSKLRAQQKQMINREQISGTYHNRASISTPTPTLQSTLFGIETRLNQKRDQAKRSKDIEKMSEEEILEEKMLLQKALLLLESLHGRPTVREERNMVRPLYDRYRALKRIVNKIKMQQCVDLVTINEDEPTVTFEKASNSVSMEEEIEQLPLLNDGPPPCISALEKDAAGASIIDVDDFRGLTHDELKRQRRLASERKKDLKRLIQQYEMDIQQKMGRRIQAEDKEFFRDTYAAYKKAKSKKKLLDALVEKNGATAAATSAVACNSNT